MNVRAVASPTRVRSRRTTLTPAGPARALLELTEDSQRGLARVSGGRPLEELVVLAAATALVTGRVEHTEEPVIGVRGPRGPVAFGAGPTAHGTVAELIRAADAGLRSAPLAADTDQPFREAVLVRSVRVSDSSGAGDSGGAAPADGQTPAGEPAAVPSGSAAVTFTLGEAHPGGRRELHAEGDPGRTEPWFLDVMLRAVAETLAAFAEPGRALAELPVCAARDRDTVDRFARGGFRPEPAELTLTAAIERTVRERADSTAIVAGEQTLTYGELWRAAEAVAALLGGLGVGRGDRVALLTGKTAHAVPAILGVLLTGAAYVPLDPRSPAARLAEILTDAECAAVLASPDLVKELPEGSSTPVIGIDAAVRHEAAFPGAGTAAGAEKAPYAPRPDDLAYIVYTSGSTGTPKGVEVQHRAVASYLRWKVRYDELDTATRLLQLPSLAFDSSVADLFPVLASGGRMVLADPHRTLPRQLAEMVARHRITHLMAVPSLYQVLLGELPGAAETLRLVTVAGEAVPAELVSRHHAVLGHVRLINEYGPTENSVGATAFTHRPDAGPGFPIGHPIENTMVTVADAEGRERPPGFVGELRLAGHGLAAGYRDRPDLTAEVFVDAPGMPGGRAYRTGDLAWWRPDGMLEFAGRVDDQVKIRGHRVELGEVESALGQLPGVRRAAVVTVREADGAQALAAWLEAPGRTAADIRSGAADVLPPAMVPARIELIESLPELVSGKTDRAALAARSARPAQPAVQTPATSPAAALKSADHVTATVAAIFDEVLGRGPSGPDTDFFMEGGHSLLAMTALVEIEQRLGVSVDLDDFFETATVRTVAELVRTSAPAPAPRPRLDAGRRERFGGSPA